MTLAGLMISIFVIFWGYASFITVNAYIENFFFIIFAAFAIGVEFIALPVAVSIVLKDVRLLRTWKRQIQQPLDSENLLAKLLLYNDGFFGFRRSFLLDIWQRNLLIASNEMANTLKQLISAIEQYQRRDDLLNTEILETESFRKILILTLKQLFVTIELYMNRREAVNYIAWSSEITVKQRNLIAKIVSNQNGKRLLDPLCLLLEQVRSQQPG